MTNAASETIQRSPVRLGNRQPERPRLLPEERPAGFVSDAAADQGGVPAESAQDLNRIVRGLAGRLHARLPRGCGIEMSDLIQAGNLGLMKAVHSFEASHGAPLTGYARFRIRGEMLDMIRRSAGRERAGALPHGAGPSGADAEEVAPASPDSSPQSSTFRQQREEIIHAELLRLPARDRAVINFRYSRDMTLRQIGEKLRVNESRACQLHQGALRRLKRALWSRGVRKLSHL